MPNTSITHDLIIIGSGPAGLTAAIYAARAKLKPIVISGPNPGGQLVSTTYIENWPGEQSILGADLMLKMREHAAHFGTNFIDQSVVKADFSQKPFKIWTSDNQELLANSVIIATGANPKLLNCPGEQTYWSKGVSTCAVCDGALYSEKQIVIIGGGDTAMEEALFLTRFNNKITIIQIGDKLTASQIMQERVLSKPEIKIIYESAVQAILGKQEHVTGVQIKNLKTGLLQELPADAVFLAIGLKPMSDLFAGQLALDNYGHILVTNQTNSSIPGIFIAGDVCDSKYRQAITAAGFGCMAALDAERYLTNQNN